MSIAIKVENLSKAYQIGQIGTGTISRDLERWFITRVMRKEDPFLKLGETNDRSTKGESDFVWSLKDINFEIEQGDAVGIIGKNGAGKSTLLKLLSRVTSPTTGKIKVRGRIASLLEVGTGFHPELTGRENIYLNGSILGMRKREIDRKLDEIIDFSGVERYIDTPVKRYSSGMYVRLAFAVAAHLESEILIVDEVLAVGDAEFQKKCLGKMGDISKGEGRTVLFVSHNMAAVKELCKKGVVLFNGMNKFDGEIKTAVSKYLKSHLNNDLIFPLDLGPIFFKKFNHNQIDQNHIFSFYLSVLTPSFTDFYIKLTIKTIQNDIIFESSKKIESNNREIQTKLEYQCDFNFLQNGEYRIYISIFEHGVRWLLRDKFLSEIKQFIPQKNNVDHSGLINPMGNWVNATN